MQHAIMTIKPNMSRMLLPYLLLSVSLAILVFLALYSFLSLTDLEGLSLSLGLSAGLIAGALSFLEYSRNASKRRVVVLKTGILEEDERSRFKPLDTIVTLKLKRDLLDKMYGTAKIYVNSDMCIEAVSNYYDKFEALKKHIQMFRSKGEKCAN